MRLVCLDTQYAFVILPLVETDAHPVKAVVGKPHFARAVLETDHLCLPSDIGLAVADEFITVRRVPANLLTPVFRDLLISVDAFQHRFLYALRQGVERQELPWKRVSRNDTGMPEFRRVVDVLRIEVILLVPVVPSNPAVYVRLRLQVRNPTLVQYDIHLGVIFACKVQEVHVYVLLKGFSVEQLAENHPVGLVIQVFDVGSVEKFADRGD